MTATTGRLLSPRATGFLSKYLIIFIFIGLVALLTVLTDGTFLKPQNIANVVRQVSVVAILAIGLTVVIITAGIDLSVGGVLALSAVVATSLAQLPEATNLMYPGLDVPVFVAIAAGLAVGAACGAINGSLVAFTGIAPFIATLGMMTASRGVALIYSGGRPVSRLKEDYNWFGRGEPFEVPIYDINTQTMVQVGIGVPILIMIIVAVLTYYFLSRRKTGKYVYAIGSNEEAVQLAGINIRLVKVLIYTFSGPARGARRHHPLGPHLLGQPHARRHDRARCHRGGRHRWRQPRRWHRYRLGRHRRRHDHRLTDDRPAVAERLAIRADGGHGRDHRVRRDHRPAKAQTSTVSAPSRMKLAGPRP